MKFAGYRQQMMKDDPKSTVRESEVNPMSGFGSSLGKLFQAIEKKRSMESESMDMGKGNGEGPDSGMDYRDPSVMNDQEESAMESPEADLAQFNPRSILENAMNGKDEMRKGARSRAIFNGPRNESYFK